MSEVSITQRALASERVIINSPMSFAGAAQRSFRIGAGAPEAWQRILVRVFVSTPLVLAWWCAVAAWYVVVIGVFGIVTIPYRILRRGARKRRAEAIRHREALAALERTTG